MRQIVLDTETTGLSPTQGHRIIEVACVEIINRRITGQHWHYYFNPEREVDAGALRVHGIRDDFLLDKPLFRDLVSDFLIFLDGAELIIHNAPFDIGFLNSELFLAKAHIQDITQYCGVIDTLALAREKHPGQKNNLDALCKRYNINNAHRTLHGALLDAEILAEVYFAMTGGQNSFQFVMGGTAQATQSAAVAQIQATNEDIIVMTATEVELAAHEAFMSSIT